MKHRKKIIIFPAIFAYLILIIQSFAATTQPVIRYAVIAGSNFGGDKERLKYAVSDAESISKVFSELGGLSDENIIMLKEPDPGELLSAFAKIKKAIN